MRNRMYGGVRGKETKIGRKTFVSLPTRLCARENFVFVKTLVVVLLKFCKCGVVVKPSEWMRVLTTNAQLSGK